MEKSWISDNKNKVIDIFVDDELPVFSLKGTGVFYDYIKGAKNGGNGGENNGNPQITLLSKMTCDDGTYEKYDYNSSGNKTMRYYSCTANGTGCNSQKFDYNGSNQMTAKYNNCRFLP